MTPPYGAILCHWDAHIVTDECGAPEMYSFGARLIRLAGEHGRISPEALSSQLREARFGVVHAVQPSVLSLTNLTEAGTAYTPDEIAALTRVAHDAGLGTHLDGARFANAAAFLDASPAELSWKSGVDIVTLGTTKSGSFGAETIVAFTPKYDTALAFLRKRGGHFAPKSRFLGAQIETYVQDGLWLENARRVSRAAGETCAILEPILSYTRSRDRDKDVTNSATICVHLRGESPVLQQPEGARSGSSTITTDHLVRAFCTAPTSAPITSQKTALVT